MIIFDSLTKMRLSQAICELSLKKMGVIYKLANMQEASGTTNNIGRKLRQLSIFYF